jgi:hypothetical protein
MGNLVNTPTLWGLTGQSSMQKLLQLPMQLNTLLSNLQHVAESLFALTVKLQLGSI